MKHIFDLLIIVSLALSVGCQKPPKDGQNITYGLPARTAIALDWLRSNKNESALATNRFGPTSAAIEFVDELFQAGATQVYVVSRFYEPKRVAAEGGPYADELIVQLPSDPDESPKALLRIELKDASPGCAPLTRATAARESAQQTPECTNRTWESTQQTRECGKRTRECAKQTRESTNRTRECVNRTRECGNRTRECEKQTRESTKRTRESGNHTQESTRRTRESVFPSSKSGFHTVTGDLSSPVSRSHLLGSSAATWRFASPLSLGERVARSAG